MPERYVEAILKYLASRRYQPLKPRQLARQMGVAEEDYDTFRTAIKRLRDSGRIVLGAKNALTLPEMSPRVVGFFRANPRGFGFVIPEEPNAHGDLFIPAEAVGGAMTGDLVVANVTRRRRRGTETIFSGQIVEILKRGQNRYVGTLERTANTWFVTPDGPEMTTPIVIRDIGAAGPKALSKVVAEIVQFGSPGELPVGVIVETLGQTGELEAETISIIRAYGLEEEFSPEGLADARTAVDAFDPDRLDGREDLAAQTVITIDPADARDFDDAVSMTHNRDGSMTLDVHIADVSHFVREGDALDKEARRRSTSAYFPRKVLPMLPQILSNGVCSLQEGQRRYTKSVLITYDRQGSVLNARMVESVICSTKRLTYEQAQGICDGKTGGYTAAVVKLLQDLQKLAKLIEARRRKAGMLRLELPEVRLVFDDNDKVADAVPEDDSYTHTMIEMFMVEANDAVARLLSRLNRPCLRRIHPAPDRTADMPLRAFVRACGHRLPKDLSRRDLQDLLDKVKGRPESYAVNLAVLKTFQQAEYSPMPVGHFALASDHYCHFTSPIRRYPDLTVHRLIAEYCRGRLQNRPPEDVAELVAMGQHCTAAEHRAESAEKELRQVLVLQFLATKIGESFTGVITGVTNFGIFIQSPRFLVDGLIRLEDLGDDWWEVSAQMGHVRGQRSGRAYRIGDMLTVRIAGVDVARRQLNLMLEQEKAKKAPKTQPRPNAKKARPRRRTRRS